MNKQEEVTVIWLTFSCIACIDFPAKSVTLSKVERSPKRCILVALMGAYNRTKFEEIWYHCLRKIANAKIFTKCILCQSSPPELNITQWNWHSWINFNLGYFQTKLHLNQGSALRDYCELIIVSHVSHILWRWIKVKVTKNTALVALTGGYNHTKCEETQCHSLQRSSNIKVSDKVTS